MRLLWSLIQEKDTDTLYDEWLPIYLGDQAESSSLAKGPISQSMIVWIVRGLVDSFLIEEADIKMKVSV